MLSLTQLATDNPVFLSGTCRREQIVQFVLQNTQGTDVMPLPPSFNPDPLTGGNAYVPGLPSTNQQQQQGGFLDPFTGAGAYVPPAAGSSLDEVPWIRKR